MGRAGQDLTSEAASQALEGDPPFQGTGMSQTFPLTFLLCDQAHEDPDGVLIGVLKPVGRVDPWGREEDHDPGEMKEWWNLTHELHQDLAAGGAPNLS